MATRAGFAVVDITPAAGVPLAGYGGMQRRSLPYGVLRRHSYATLFKPSNGVLDPLRAKALVLERGGRRLVFLSLDVLGVSGDLHRDIVAGLQSSGFDPSTVFVSATHTHSGSGTLSHEFLWQALAMDRSHAGVRAKFIAGVIAAVRDADAALRPAALHAVSFAADGLQRNRRHAVGFCDSTANVLLAACSATGRWLGAMVNLAIHGTAMSQHNLRFSADVPGGIERALQDRLGVPVLFVNGAEGDVSPITRGPAGIEHIATRFADQAMAALPGARPIEGDWSVQTRIVRLLKPRILLPQHEMTRRLGLTIGLGRLVPRQVPLSVIRLGDMMLFAWPGEPTTSVGITTKDVAREAGAAQAWVLGLTNGYVGYFVTPNEYRAGGYEAWASLYGPDAATRLIDEFRSMAGVNGSH